MSSNTEPAPTHRPAGPDERRIAARQALMRWCAKATEQEMKAALQAVGFDSAGSVRVLRAPEVGLVMLRGRAGGSGAPFNVGEATVTRAVVELASGETGFGYCLGRDTARARHAAMIDALGQHPDLGPRMRQSLAAATEARLEAESRKAREQTAATRVNFFTLVRGED